MQRTDDRAQNGAASDTGRFNAGTGRVRAGGKEQEHLAGVNRRAGTRPDRLSANDLGEPSSCDRTEQVYVPCGS